MTFLKVWIAYAIVGSTVFSLAFIWAVRARQFSDLDRGRYIPLHSDASDESDQGEAKPARIDRYTWAGLVVLLAAATAAVLLVAAKGT